jgi:hypothetical protein
MSLRWAIANARRNEQRRLKEFIRKVKRAAEEQCSLLGPWRPAWDGICEDFWKFDFAPEQALEAIEEKEGIAS